MFHYLYPLFHRPTFERQVFQEKLHLRNRLFGSTLLMVCANASRHSNDSRNLYTQSEHSLGWRYFRQVRFFRVTYLQPMTLYEVQLYAASSFSFQCLLIIDFYSSWRSCFCFQHPWGIARGHGICVGHAYGWHTPSCQPSESSPNRVSAISWNANFGSERFGCSPSSSNLEVYS